MLEDIQQDGLRRIVDTLDAIGMQATGDELEDVARGTRQKPGARVLSVSSHTIEQLKNLAESVLRGCSWGVVIPADRSRLPETPTLSRDESQAMLDTLLRYGPLLDRITAEISPDFDPREAKRAVQFAKSLPICVARLLKTVEILYGRL